jgi:tight adherence protein B
MISYIPSLVFGAVLAVFGALGMYVRARRMVAAAALRRRLGEALTAHGRGADSVASARGAEQLRQLIGQSGLHWTVGDFMSRALLAGGLGVVVGALAGSPLLSGLLGLAGPVVVWAVLQSARRRRIAQCERQMPHALELMVMALRAGQALPGAIALAASETPAPLGEELQRAVDEQALGRPLDAVLQGLAARLPNCTVVNSFVVSILVLQETGGNIIGVLDRMIDGARARTSYESRLRALTSEGRTSAWILGSLPGLFLVLASVLDPQFSRFVFADPAGHRILFIVAALWLGGVVWVRRLVGRLE